MGNMIGIDAKLHRAADNLEQLRAFIHNSPYVEFAECELDTRELVYRVNIPSEAYMARLSAVLGDVLGNLHSALDYLIHEITGYTGEDLQFPMAATADGYRGNVKGLRHILPKERRGVIALLQGVEAYPGGNGEGLCQVRQMNNINKHRLLIAASSTHRSAGITFPLPKGWANDLDDDSRQAFAELVAKMTPLHLNPADKQFPLKDGAAVFRNKVGCAVTDMEMYSGSTFDVVFGEGEMFAGQPVLPIVIRLGKKVAEVVKTLQPYV